MIVRDDATVTELTLRTAAVDDVPALVQLIHAAYRRPDSGGWTTEADLLGGQRIDAEMLGELVAEPDAHVVVGVMGARVAACGALRHTEGTAIGEFGLFAVDPTLQGRGIGGRVLHHAEGLAAMGGATRLRLEVIHTRHELLAWYRRRGYEPTGETSPFPYGDERFGLPRRSDLYFVILERVLAAP